MRLRNASWITVVHGCRSDLCGHVRATHVVKWPYGAVELAQADASRVRFRSYACSGCARKIVAFQLSQGIRVGAYRVRP